MPIARPAADRADAVEQSDEEVIREVLNGQTAMFELLMRRYNTRVYRAARAIVRNEHEAEDVMQQAYVNAFAHLGHFTGAARFSTWLTRIAINESLARVKRDGQRRVLEEGCATPLFHRAPEDPERQAMATELRSQLEAAIDTLPDGLREVFVLREVEGLSTSDTAALLSVSSDVVKTRLFRARAALKRFLSARAGIYARDVFRFYRPRCDRIVAAVLARLVTR